MIKDKSILITGGTGSLTVSAEDPTGATIASVEGANECWTDLVCIDGNGAFVFSVSDTEDVIASGSFTAASSTYPWFSYTDSDSVNLTAAAAAGTVYEIEVNEGVIDAFEADLRNGATATLSASGTVSDAPITFVVRITADVKVTVDAI